MERLISLDELLRFPIRADHCDKEHANEDFINGIETVFEYVETLPTIDAEPVRHGKWLPREASVLYPFWERYTCSECGKHSDDTRYCPNCGAKMDGCN